MEQNKNWFLMSFYWQTLFFVVSAIVVNIVFNKGSAVSVLLGGLAYCVPSLLINLYCIRAIALSDLIVKAYIGIVTRFILSGSALVLIFERTQADADVVIGCFCLATVVQYVTSFFLINNKEK